MTTQGKGIPFVNLAASHAPLMDEFMEICKEVLSTGNAIGGPMVEGFEKAFADYCGVKHCIGVSNGTDGLRFALIAAGVEKGDAVVTVPNTFVATVEAIVQAGAFPQFVDINPQTYNMSVEALQQYIEIDCDRCERTGLPIDRKTGRRVKAIIPVHLYGQMADMDPIMALAEKYGMIVLEDSCQGHGAEYYSQKEGRWKRAGSVGHVAAFSFYPTKNLGAVGEGGAVTTNDDKIAAKLRMIREHGQSKKYYHAIEGYNGRLDAMQAGFLKIKLARLEEWNGQRRCAANTYGELLAGAEGITTPCVPAWDRPVYHLYVIRTENRDALQQYLTQHKIGTSLHYPLALHLQEAFRYLGYREGDFPESERACSEILSLPMFPELERSQQEEVVARIREYLGVAENVEEVQTAR